MSQRKTSRAQHFRKLEPCPIDHARQYLVIMERDRRFELYIVHHLGSGSNAKRKYQKVSSFRKSELTYRHLANMALKPLDTNAEILREVRGKLSHVITNLESADKKQELRCLTSG